MWATDPGSVPKEGGGTRGDTGSFVPLGGEDRMNCSQPIAPRTEFQYSRGTAVTLSCKRQETFFIVLSGSFLKEKRKRAIKSHCRRAAYTKRSIIPGGPVRTLWPSPALCSLRFSHLPASVSVPGLSESARWPAQGKQETFFMQEQHAFPFSTNNVLSGFQCKCMGEVCTPGLQSYTPLDDAEMLFAACRCCTGRLMNLLKSSVWMSTGRLLSPI